MRRHWKLNNSRIRKYSAEISGRLTSVSLEPEFYQGLREIAVRCSATVSSILTQLDADHPRNL